MEQLELVGLTATTDRRVGGSSLGMRQRLGIARTLVGEPAALIVDEPANGLDPEGIALMRGLLRDFAEVTSPSSRSTVKAQSGPGS